MIPVFGSAGSKSEKITIELYRRTGELLKAIRVRKGTNLWVALRRFGVPIGASCSGVGVCGKCAVEITRSTDCAVNTPSELEQHTVDRQGLPPHLRLACLCRVTDNVSIQADYW
jgi:ferredoxin